jgi:transcriptional regulator with GAF, ATPase, and Fis domain
MTRPDGTETKADALVGGAPVTAKVVVVAGPDEGLERALDGPLEIGTDPACTMVLSDPKVSRRHLLVKVRGGRIHVKDLGSRNGTFLGGARIVDAEVPLGVVLEVGQSFIAVQPRVWLREVQPSNARAFGALSGESVAMREVFAIFERVAPTDVTVLIDGESGTGKELAARSIHQASARAIKPYVVFDCGSVPSELAESELFGHKKGAFSGATSDRAGAFQQADGGTLCLDELGELPLELQPKLLRAIDSGEVRPVGEDVPRKVDVRIIAATNRDLHSEARRGRFRSDLLYRLEVVRVRLPPLRHRPEDLPGLVARLLEGKLPDGDVIDGENLKRLMAYSWPGNVRELKNTLIRAVALARPVDGSVAPFSKLVFNLGPASSMPVSIGSEFPGIASNVQYKEAKAQLVISFERAYVARLLERFSGNVTQAAAAAGLSRKHLHDLIKRVEEGSAEDV